MAADFVRHSIAVDNPDIHSRDDLIRFLRNEYVAFPDANEQIADISGEGEKVAARMHFHGTQTGAMGKYPPTGRTLGSEYIVIYRIQGERIAEAWAEWESDKFEGIGSCSLAAESADSDADTQWA